MEMEQAIDAVRDYLDEQDYRYEYNPERHCLLLGFALPCKLRNTRISVGFHEQGYAVSAMSPLSAAPDNLQEMLRYLAMANYSLLDGGFEIDVHDGEISYRCYVGTRGLGELPPEIIEESLTVPCAMLVRYGNGIAALAMGFSDAETEIKKADEAVEGEDGE